MDYKDQILKSLSEVTGIKDINLETPGNEDYGDYSTNIAMLLASKKGETKNNKSNPTEIAQGIVQSLSKDKVLQKIVSKISVEGPGFINFHLSKEALFDNLSQILERHEKYGHSNLGKKEKVIIEYSSPNIARRFGIGHLRSTIIGQTIFNLYTTLGFDTVGDNHFGDWGTQFGVIIAAIKRNNLDINNLSVQDLEKLYVEYNLEAQTDPKLKEDAKKWFKRLEDKDPQAREIWQKSYDQSLAEFEKIYDLLEVKIDNGFGESFYEDKMSGVIAEAREKNITKKSESAEIIEFDDLPPAMLLKSDGATTYFTRDLTTIKYRLDTYHPKKIIYEVGVEQTLHFKQVFAAAKKIGWIKNNEVELVHVSHGHYRLEGKKMSTRLGRGIKLEEILRDAVKKAHDLGSKDEKTAQDVGIGAIKYFDLSHAPETFIDFNWDQVMNMQGNSGPYLQYTHARTQSVLAKVKKVEKSKNPTLNQSTLNENELTLLRILCRFDDVIISATKNYSPNLMCNYLNTLSQKYNTFYAKYSILTPSENDQEKRKFRIMLTQGTGQILRNGLTLLGINAPDKM
ncbi:arginine--tRNA ligase [Candidatus Woesebacteria bacterium RIFOXYB1_FULL_38_16]|uniref:Arginine--tRNA ligase n=1 Tax=Candidatus Woesebacteria bacterium RIFOXYB1_FULL_38_16 TaxID=1802538 RepID=A0A1F8CUD1_9BACT|nr:MAG: arginine--tRNA ligase [Candidatus Woesebacteria bacterium RIFOXYA1_FULL_38_9]OGM79696.1 MAG: arginine--tRNA ligase [Candidatus Woesebacteria bacterium RIFOXYB1_FULL_38_16]